MAPFISKIIFSEMRFGCPVDCATVSNTTGKSDSEMIENANELLERWQTRGHVITYRIVRNYKINA